MKANIGFDVNSKLLHTIDLAYHTPLMFNFGEETKIRATLDTLVISESRVGKSTTAQALQKGIWFRYVYFLSWKCCTIAGLVGGSTNKIGTSNNFQTRAGIIPQNHRTSSIRRTR